jgi:hypothetical protein
VYAHVGHHWKVTKRQLSLAPRYVVVAIGALAYVLTGTTPVSALPLASEQPGSATTALVSPHSTIAPGISVWSFVHPGSSDLEQSGLEFATVAATTVANTPQTIEPSWDVGPVENSVNGQAIEVDDPTAGLFAANSTLSGAARAVRKTTGGQRLSRTEPETFAAPISGRLEATPQPLRFLLAYGPAREDTRIASGLFRPPRTAIRLP